MGKIIGIDVGGTNTDAVLISEGRIVQWVKTPTTPDMETGLLDALARVDGGGSADRVHIGTTAFTNALVERRQLATAAAIRIGAPVSESLPPMVDWPDDLRRAVNNPVFFLQGGREFNGRPIRKLKRSDFRRVALALAEQGVTQAAACWMAVRRRAVPAMDICGNFQSVSGIFLADSSASFPPFGNKIYERLFL